MFKQKSDPSAASARLEPADAVRLARVKARQRLIGAIVLLGIGIIGFPLVFETQPRPIPVDIPIEIPRRDALPPLAMPPPRLPPAASGRATPEAASAAPAGAAPRTAARASEAVITESSSDAGREIPPPRPVASNPRVAATPAAPPTAPTAPAATAPKISADGERAKALLEGRSAAATDETRFVVQVGAFADAEAARETRKRVEKLGFKTYTQVAQTPSGSRIRVRVGPFASRGEAESALAKAKAAGLSAVLLTL